MELHELICLNQYNDYNESPVDVPDSLIAESKFNKFKYKIYQKPIYNGYMNEGFFTNECLDNKINENIMNYFKDTSLNGFTTEDTFDGFCTYRTVTFNKKLNEPLGLTIKNDHDKIIVGRIIKNGLVEKSSSINEGDEIITINQIKMKGYNVNQISNALAKTSGRLTFLIVVNKKKSINQNLYCKLNDSEIHLKAMFDYDPTLDPYIPCKEVGIKFKKGQVLHIIDQTDHNWWQANLENDENNLAGLIPSTHLQLLKNSMEYSYLKKPKNFLLCGKWKKKINQQKVLNSCIYEKVDLYFPKNDFKRPIVLVGSINIGIFELRKKLLQSDTRFGVPPPHTTRTKQYNEIDGFDYNFCSHSEFEREIKNNKLIEYGQYKNDYYGLSIDSVLNLIQSGKICLLNLNASTIPKIRQEPLGSLLKPYIIFISVSSDIDNLDKLKVVEQSTKIEQNFGHYFDKEISMTNFDETYEFLLEEIKTVEIKPNWVPSSWIPVKY